MSKHWPPPDWGRTNRRSGGGGGSLTLAVPVLLGAVLLGLVAGAALHWSEAPPTAAAPEWALPEPKILLPEAEADTADDEWAQRAEGQVGPSTSPDQVRGFSGRTGGGVRASFSFCHAGGGSNCVVDGDTFYIGGAKVRIAGIDAPETHPPRCAHEARLGRQATEQLQALLNSGAVTMTGIDRDRDSYGRLLRNVQVNGLDVGEALISAGVAREYGSGRRGWC